MGYFDALTSGAFKTTPDGRRLFFPWGALGAATRSGPSRTTKRCDGVSSFWTIVGLVLILVACQLLGFLAGFIVSAAMIAFYCGWMRYVLRSLRRRPKGSPSVESMIAQARAQSPALLWTFLIVSIAFVLGSVFILIVHPRQMGPVDNSRLPPAS